MTGTTFSERAVARTAGWLGRRTGRRSFLVKTAVIGSALAVNPFRYVLRPGTAYASLCGPASDCGSGWSAMCCSINHGQNTCPPGSIPGGWWKVDRSGFCAGGPRYYIDCNSTCSCGCGGGGICSPSCQTCGCRCNTGSCDQRRVCCNQFRYGQCNQQVRCVGAVVCRVILCSPPWEFDHTCSHASATSNATAGHDAPCLHTKPHHFAQVFALGAAPNEGAPTGELHAAVTGMDRTATGKGYWLVSEDGGIFTFGDATFHGSLGNKHLNQPIVDIAKRSAEGYWLVARDGGIFTFGNARFHGSLGGRHLNRPIVGMTATPSGLGYWLVASDGGIFTFGDATFHGSLGNKHLNQPIVGMAATPTGRGYWLVAGDGGIFTFGDATFHGSLGNLHLPRPIASMAATTSGKGYWMVRDDGGVYALGDAHYYGPAALTGLSRAVDIARRPTGDGYWVVADVTVFQ